MSGGVSVTRLSMSGRWWETVTTVSLWELLGLWVSGNLLDRLAERTVLQMSVQSQEPSVALRAGLSRATSSLSYSVFFDR